MSFRGFFAPFVMSMPDKFSNPSWDSFLQWVLSQRAKIGSIETAHFESSGLTLMQTRQKIAFSDEPHPDLVLQFIDSGHCEFAHGDMGYGRFQGWSDEGQWALVPPNCTLELDGRGDFGLIMASMPFEGIRRDLERLAGRPISDFGCLHAGLNEMDPFINTAMRQLWDQRHGSELYADSMMTMVITRLMQLAGHMPDSSDKVRGLSAARLERVLQYLHANAETRKSCLSELADEADMSRFQLIRAFKASTGSTPHDYLVRLRVELGKQRMLGGQSATKAALESGFYDQAHFTRQFKKAYGIPPGRYRREMGP